MLQAKNIQKAYAHSVLKGIDLDLQRGCIVGLAGKNGSGKSTLLSILVSILKPDQGTVTLDNEDIFSKHFCLNGKIAFVPQENTLFEMLSVSDNLNFWASAFKKKYSSKYLSQRDLKKKVKELSGGMKKKLSLEIALMNSPEFIIMDEPTAALDIVFQKQILDLIWDLKNQGKAILFTTHYSDELSLCDIMYLLQDGKFAYAGSPSAFCAGGNFKDSLYEAVSKGLEEV